MSTLHICSTCHAYMRVETLMDVVIVCDACATQRAGTPEDTLIWEQNRVKSTDNTMKHAELVYNSPYDAAASMLRMDCPQCAHKIMVCIKPPNESAQIRCGSGVCAYTVPYVQK